ASASMRSPRSLRSQARATASCTASSARARLPQRSVTAPTRRGYWVARNSRIWASSSSHRSCPTPRDDAHRLPRVDREGKKSGSDRRNGWHSTGATANTLEDVHEMPDLTERKTAILRALVQVYIGTGEAVGSEAVAQASALGLSSATIRNELAALE